MNLLIQNCLESSDIENRTDESILEICQIFRKFVVDPINKLSDEKIKIFLRNAAIEKFDKNELIMKQGCSGEKYYIVLKGKISIHVDDEESLVEITNFKKIPSRDCLGNLVKVEREGYGFGEFSLIEENGTHRASVLADVESVFLSVNKSIYSITLKDLHEKKMASHGNFIKSLPLFSNWSPKLKMLLLHSFQEIIFKPGSYVIKQGDKIDGLIFIIEGWAEMSVDPSKFEKQYPEYFPLDFDIFNEIYIEFPELKPIINNQIKSEAECLDEMVTKRTRLLRNGDYAALEKLALRKDLKICTVQNGEIIGDIEFILQMPTHLFSLKAIQSDVHIFHLSQYNIDRILKRISFSDLTNKIKSVIRQKLNYRKKIFENQAIDFMLYIQKLLYFNDDLIKNKWRKVAEKGSSRSDKYLNLSDEEERHHLLRMFMQNKAQICLPYVKGAVYLKDLMQINAKKRQNQKKLVAPESNIMPKVAYDELTFTYPLSQEKIYELQKEARTPVNFIERVRKLLEERSRKPKPIQKTATIFVDNSDPITSTENDVIDGPAQIQSHESIIQNIEPTMLNLSRDKSDRFKNSVKKIQFDSPNDFLASKECVSHLQTSQINFLNSLCSEKSQYQLYKTPKESDDFRNNKRVYFLPKLKNQNEIRLSEAEMKKGARVLVKKQPCIALKTGYKLLNHSHNHFKIVDQLEDKKIDKMKEVISKFMST